MTATVLMGASVSAALDVNMFIWLSIEFQVAGREQFCVLHLPGVSVAGADLEVVEAVRRVNDPTGGMGGTEKSGVLAEATGRNGWSVKTSLRAMMVGPMTKSVNRCSRAANRRIAAFDASRCM